MKKVVISMLKKGNKKGEFIFTFFAPNGKDVGGSRPETYHNKQDLIDTLNHNFPDWEQVDRSDEVDPRVHLVDDAATC